MRRSSPGAILGSSKRAGGAALLAVSLTLFSAAALADRNGGRQAVDERGQTAVSRTTPRQFADYYEEQARKARERAAEFDREAAEHYRDRDRRAGERADEIRSEPDAYYGRQERETYDGRQTRDPYYRRRGPDAVPGQGAGDGRTIE